MSRRTNELLKAKKEVSVQKTQLERWKATGVIALSECNLKVIEILSVLQRNFLLLLLFWINGFIILLLALDFLIFMCLIWLWFFNFFRDFCQFSLIFYLIISRRCAWVCCFFFYIYCARINRPGRNSGGKTKTCNKYFVSLAGSCSRSFWSYLMQFFQHSCLLWWRHGDMCRVGIFTIVVLVFIITFVLLIMCWNSFLWDLLLWIFLVNWVEIILNIFFGVWKAIPEEVWICGSSARLLDLSHNLIQEVPDKIGCLSAMQVNRTLSVVVL